VKEFQSSLDKSLSLMVLALERRNCSLSSLANAAELPVSTAHRLLGGLQKAGLIAQIGRHVYVGGPTLRRLTGLQIPPRQILIEAGRPVLAELSNRTRRITHLGILEDNMMTYLVKEGDPQDRAPSRPNIQLEAYCSAVGKALLAHLPEAEREAYLATAPFVRLTPNTITSAAALRAEFERTRVRGYALDIQEMFDGMICIAVPVRVGGRAVAAVSVVASQDGGPCRPVSYLARLRAAASKIESKLHAVCDMFS
jgi:DNA-binding IclR family transcriptional regulator